MDSDEHAGVRPSGSGALPALQPDPVAREAQEAALQEVLIPEEPGIVVLQGADGMGKTTLLAQVATRLKGTQRFERVVYTGYGGGGLAELALRDLAAVSLAGSHEHAPVPMNRLEEALTEHPTLICWDDIDAVLGEGPMSLSDVTRQELLNLAQHLATVGSTRVLLSYARVPSDAALSGIGAQCVQVGGLAPNEAVGLWRRWQYAEQVDDADVARLADLLGGNPLALRLAGYLASSYGLEAAEHALEEALPGFAHGEGRLGNQGLHAAMEAWLQQIPATYSKALMSMGVFVQGFVANLPARVGDVPDSTWAEALGVLVRSGLAHTEPIMGLKVPYVRVHSALLAHLARRLDQAQAMRLRSRYAGNYAGLIKWMTTNRERASEAVTSLRRFETPNLRHILPILIASGEMRMAREFTQGMADLLQEDGLQQEAGLVRDAVGRAISQLLQQQQPLSRPAVHLLIDEADNLMERGHYGEAGLLLHQVCDRFRDEKGISYSGMTVTFDHAKACRRLGHALIALRQTDLALAPLVQTEVLLDKLAGQEAIGEEVLELALDLAPLYLSHDQVDKAQALWERALPLAEAAGRFENVVRMRQQLAAQALGAEDIGLAEEHLQAALDALGKGDDMPEAEASLHDQLAAVALRRGDHDSAIESLKRAVALYRDQEKHPAEAVALVRLSGLLREERRFSEAEAHLARAAALYQEANQRSALATVELDLAQLLMDQGRSPEARVHAEAARAILEDRKTQGPIWRAYTLLEEIERAAGNIDDADRLHASAVEAYAGSASARRMIAKWVPLLGGLIQTCHGQALDNDIAVALEEMEQDPAWRDTANVLWRVLDGERGDELYQGLDVRQAVLVKALLAGIEAPEPDEQGHSEEGTPRAEDHPQPSGSGIPHDVQATIRRVFVTVMQAVRGDPNAHFVAGMLLGTLQQQGNPEPMVKYAHAMERILAGERDPALAQGLPKELAEPVWALLGALAKQPVPRA
ncbi:MAG: tetratricopeptide repeat protein [Anaerolineae bacterium]|nr:tetratricopeptide repeat protein [Anaerolineae bacterium]